MRSLFCKTTFMVLGMGWLSLIGQDLQAQQYIPLHDLNAFDQPSSNWTIEAGVKAQPSDTAFQIQAGKGVLVNTLRNGKYRRQDDLRFKLQHGDIRLKLDFLLPKGANSGIYLQGRYEIQLFDSWGKTKIKFGDCGGIYERWDNNRGKGKEGYEGFAPRLNASKAPGLWQHIDIDFQAPRFDANGKKLSHAIVKKVYLNGVLIQENIVLSGMTRGALFEQEAPMGPIIIQGDHGPIAFKNIWYETYDLPSLSLSGVQYKVYEGKFPDFKPTPNALLKQSGPVSGINHRNIELKSDFLAIFEGDLQVPAEDDYTFTAFWTGAGQVRVDGQLVCEGARWYNQGLDGKIHLTAGKHRLSLAYAKDFPWGPKALGLQVKRVGAPMVALHERTSLPDPEAVGLVEVKVGSEPTMQRSFAFHQGKKKTHVIHVGFPAGMHYSYDLKQAGLMQVWRGPFLDATQMWHDRGEPQTAEPLGLRLILDGKLPITLENQALADSLSAEELQYQGYRMQDGRPIFKYRLLKAGLSFEDDIRPNAQGNGLERSFRLLEKDKAGIDLLMNGLDISREQPLSVDASRSHFIQINAGKGQYSTSATGSTLRLPFSPNQALSYQIIW